MTVATVIHPYPTQADAFRALGDEYNRTRLTPTVKILFRKLLNMRSAPFFPLLLPPIFNSAIIVNAFHL